MKKIVLITLLFTCAFSFGQIIPTFYFDLGQFQDSAGSLVLEDFSGGPGGGMNNCGPTVSNNGDGCFPAGEIGEGIILTTSDNGDITLLDAGFEPNQTVALIGSSDVSQSTIITFTSPVYEVAFVLYTNQDEFTNYKIFDINGDIISDESVYPEMNNEYFVGLTSQNPISVIEIIGENNSDAFFGSLYYTKQEGPGNGESACEQDNTSNSFEGGLPYSAASLEGVANDIIVAPGENFELQQIVYNSFHEAGESITGVDINYYEWGGGLPGTLIGSQTNVSPTSQSFLGTAQGYDISEIVLDITPILFEGTTEVTTTYWVEITNGVSSAGGDLFWESSSNEVNGNPIVRHFVEDEFFFVDPVFTDQDGVYSWNGECTTLGTSDFEIQGFDYYPNPTNSLLHLSAIQDIKEATIYNQLGQTVIKQNINNISAIMDLSNLGSGAYIMKVNASGQIGTYKIIKN